MSGIPKMLCDSFSEDDTPSSLVPVEAIWREQRVE